MAVIKSRTALRIVRGIKVFLHLDAGIVNGDVPDPDSFLPRLAEAQKKVKRLEGRLAESNREVARLKTVNAEVLARAKAGESRDFDADNIIWVFGTIRTGSTWLGQMMGDMPGCSMWNEPRIGEMFGYFYYDRAAHRRENKNFILGNTRRKVWLRSIRTFLLDSVKEKYPGFLKGDYLVIKEPSGSIGAPILAEATPESRLVLLVRDPRDMVASALDATREGSWAYNLKGSRKMRAAGVEGEHEDLATDEREDEIVKSRAEIYLRDVGNSRAAFDAHGGPKALVRYEDLLADTEGTMRKLYSDLGIEVGDEDLARAVGKRAWDNIPEEEKGEGKFHRKGQSGSWKDDLTAEQARTVEEITAPLLEEFYPEATA